MKASEFATLPSDKSFGAFFSAIFFVAAAYSLWKGLATLGLLLLLPGGALAVLTVARPHALAPLNRYWFQLGLLLGRVVNPIVLGAIYFLVLTPIALITRRAGRDVLSLKKRSVQSYWHTREPPGPDGDSFKNQF